MTWRLLLRRARSLIIGGLVVALAKQASLAKEKFKGGSQGWRRAEDILNYRQPGASE